MYHSVSQRLIKQKKYDQAISLLLDGARNMIVHDQLGSAIDLSERLMDAFDVQKTGLCDNNRNILYEIFDLFDLNSKFCDVFCTNTLKWSNQYCNQVMGDVSLCHYYGVRYFRQGLYYDAEYFLVHGNEDSSKLLGILEYEFALQNQYDDYGYFIARGVLPLLILCKINEAEICFNTFKSKLPSTALIDSTLSKYPLMNLVQVMLKMIESGDGNDFTLLLNQFQESLSFDSYLMECCDLIGRQYFKIGVKTVINPFADIFKSIMKPPEQIDTD
jgi:hypothetical protein